LLNNYNAIQSGIAGTDGQYKLYSEQGATDYMATINPNATMTSDANFYLPADEPAGTYLVNMTSGGVMGFDATDYQEEDATIDALAGLTIQDVSVIEGTGADAFGVVTSGGNNYIFGSNSGNSALEFKAPQSVVNALLADTVGTDGLATQEDLDAKANLASPTFTGTVGADIIAATGAISGNMQVTLDTDASIVLTAAMCRNAVRINNDADAIDYTLPACAAGLCIQFGDIAGGVITIDPYDATDTIYLNYVSVGAGDAIDSPGVVGDYITLIGLDDTRWIAIGGSGLWVDGGVD
jgi:hypothetical protein